MTCSIYVEALLFLHGDIGPPVPRTHSDLFGKRENAVGGSPAIASDDYQSLGDAGQRMPYGFDVIPFPAVFDRGEVDLPGFGQPAYKAASVGRAGDDALFDPFERSHDLGRSARNGFDVRCEQLRRFSYDERVVGIDVDDRLHSGSGKPES